MSTGGGALHFETLVNNHENLGPSILASSDAFSFDADGDNEGAFTQVTNYWDDPPCHTRKKYCLQWNDTDRSCPECMQRNCPAYQAHVGGLAAKCTGPYAAGKGGRQALLRGHRLSAGRLPRRGDVPWLWSHSQNGAREACTEMPCVRLFHLRHRGYVRDESLGTVGTGD